MDKHTLYLDKSNIFECNVSLEGASLQGATSRVILESDKCNYIFYGKITKEGKCSFSIPKLSGLLSEGDAGTIKMEFIAEDSYFQPWSSPFLVESFKKMRVENITTSANSKPKIMVEVESSSQKEFKTIVSNVTTKAASKNILTESLAHNKKYKKALVGIIKEELKSAKYKHDINTLIKRVVKNIT